MSITQQDLVKLMQTLKPSVERDRQDTIASEVLERVSKKLDDLFNNYAEKQIQSPRRYEYDPEEFALAETDPTVALRKALYSPARDEITKRFQVENDRMLIVASLMKVHPSQTSLYRSFKEGKTELAKAMADVVGVGAEWRPEAFSADFIERMEGEYKVAGLIKTIPISNRTGSLKIPAAGEAANIYLISGATKDDDIDKIPATTPGTRSITIEPEKFGARVLLDADLQEDAYIDMADYIRSELFTAAARGVDDVCINGDDSSTHQDSDVTLAIDHRKAWKGFRKLAPSSSKVDLSDTINITTFRQLWSKMSTSIAEYGMPEDCVILCNQLCFARFMTISEVLTVDKYGTKATIVTGELGSLFNIPIVPTSLVRRNLNASAVYDGSTTGYTEYLIVNKKAFLMGTKRSAKVESAKDIDYDRTKFVITLREKMVSKYPDTEPIVAVGYDINVTT